MINLNGIMEPWSGIFHSIEDAKKWYIKNGKFFEDLGYKLELMQNETTI